MLSHALLTLFFISQFVLYVIFISWWWYILDTKRDDCKLHIEDLFLSEMMVSCTLKFYFFVFNHFGVHEFVQIHT